MIFIIIIVMACIIGIVVLNLKPEKSSEEKRADFLEKAASFMEGAKTPIPGYKDSYAIAYNYQGHQCVYEDYIDRLTHVAFNRSFLKIHTNSNITLKFNEKVRESALDKNSLRNILRPANSVSKKKINVPSEFEAFDVSTNDRNRLSDFFENKKICAFLRSFIVTDERGYSQMALSIREGDIVLEFNTRFGYLPNLVDLQNNPHSLENYTKKLLILANFLNHSR